jgi:hypothetical protein
MQQRTRKIRIGTDQVSQVHSKAAVRFCVHANWRTQKVKRCFSGNWNGRFGLVCWSSTCSGVETDILGIDRGPDGRTCTPACERFFRNLNPQAVQSLQKVRFFTQMFWLEAGHQLFYIFSLPQFRPTQLTITIRYSDWWFWENDEPLRMEEQWLRYFEGNPGLRVLNVEYETLSWKRAEMMHIIERNKKWKLPVRREGGSFQSNELEGYLSAEGTGLKEWKWKGPSKLGGERWSHHGTGDKVEYVVVTDTWNFLEGELSEKEMEGRLTSMVRAPEERRGKATGRRNIGVWRARLRERTNTRYTS